VVIPIKVTSTSITMSTFIDLDSVWRDRQTYPNPCDYELTPDQVDTWVRAVREVRALPQSANERPLDFVTSINVINLTLPYPRIELYAPRLIVVSSILANVATTIDPHGLTTGDIVMTSSPGYAISSGIQRNVEYHVIVLSATTFSLELTSGGGAITLVNGTGIDLPLAVIDNPVTPGSNYTTVTTAWTSALQLLDFPRIYLDFHSHRYNDTRFLKTIKGVLADAKFVLTIDRTQFDDTLAPKWLHYKTCGEQVMRFKRDDPVVFRLMSRDGTTLPFFTEPDLTVPSNPDKQTMLTVNCIPYLRDAVFVNHATEPIV
jgi:hypothetical protein